MERLGGRCSGKVRALFGCSRHVIQFLYLACRSKRDKGAGREDSGIAEVYMGGRGIGTTEGSSGEELGIITTTFTMIFLCTPHLFIIVLLSTSSHISYTAVSNF